MLDSEAEAWKAAFADLEEGSGFPERIVGEQRTYDRPEIFERWRVEREQKAPAAPAADKDRQTGTADSPLSPERSVFDCRYNALPPEERKALDNRILAEMPEFLRQRYKRLVVYGNQQLEDLPTLYHLFRSIRDRLLGEGNGRKNMDE